MDIEGLLDLADELAAKDSPRPDFPLPNAFKVDPPDELMQMNDGPKGRGWYAKKDISAGTILLVSKPLAMVMAWEEEEDTDDVKEEEGDDEEEEEEEEEGPTGSKQNGLLILKLLHAIEEKPSLWFNVLSELFPRDEGTALNLPVWMCRDAAVGMEIERSFDRLKEIPELNPKGKDAATKQITLRLPLIVRYNCLSVETAPELLVHPSPEGHASLSGTALYHNPSFFNHDHHPNASRWSIGDIMFFVTNRDVRKGEEICISYIEHDILCESAERRSALLDMDFVDNDDVNADGSADTSRKGDRNHEGPLAPVVDAGVQAELMEMQPLERIDALQDLLDQSTGTKMADDEMEEDEGEPAPWFKSDTQNLRILYAITLDGLSRTKQALEEWEKCVAFCEQALPPVDESSIAMRVQASLCARLAGRDAIARKHADAALKEHSILFGGGVARFRRRYEVDLKLALRPDCMSEKGVSAQDVLWPVP